MGINLLKYRDEKNLSREQLAEIIGISARHLCNIENGKCNTTLRALEKIMKATGLSVAELLK